MKKGAELPFAFIIFLIVVLVVFAIFLIWNLKGAGTFETIVNNQTSCDLVKNASRGAVTTGCG
jgi:hypothetical protein